jgi:arginyl-tRNA synthetase
VSANVFRNFSDQVKAAVAALGLPEVPFAVELPRETAHGDWTTNIAMVLTKQAGKPPRVLAEQILPLLAAHADIEKVEIAGPGFINVTMKTAFWQQQLASVLEAGTHFGDSALGGNVGINIEFCSANPTGPMHTAHARGTCLGDALANLLGKVGYKVTREYYINDAGNQVDILGRSTHLRYREALGEGIGEIPKGLYPGDYLKDVAQALVARDGDKWLKVPEAEWLPPLKAFAMEQLLTAIKRDLQSLHVTMDVYTSEKAIRDSGKVDVAYKLLKDRDLIYTGILEKPKGRDIPDWEPVELELFRATNFGDDTDRPVRRADGSYTYLMPDIAYHYDKFVRSGPMLVTVVGADHGGWAKPIKAAVAAVTDGKAQFSIKMVAMVNTLDNGEPVRMSKRAGTFVTLNDIVERVGGDVMRFVMLTRRPEEVIDFDFTKVVEQSKDNPVFYVQYAHARCRSVLRQASAQGLLPDVSKLAELTDSDELGLIKKLLSWPRLVEQAAIAQEPHRIAYYLQETAAGLHGLWNKGSEDATLRFIRADAPAATAARLALVAAVATVIASGLAVLGVTPVEEMR